MSVVIFLFTMLIICLYSLVDIMLSGKVLLVRNIAVGMAYYMCAFMVFSLIAFAIDIYSLSFVYIIILLLALLLLLLLYYTRYKSIDALRKIEFIKYFPIGLLIVLIVGFLFSFQKFGIYGMGQDQGVYQKSALQMVNGNNSKLSTVKEYDLLTNEEDKALFLGLLEQQQLTGLGFYSANMNENRGTIAPGSYPVNSATYHGLQNFPALLSITGKILGEEHIMHGLTIPFLISIVLLFITLNLNLGIGELASSIATAIFTLSPIVLWTSKASLTEIYLAMIISLFLYFLTNKDNEQPWLLWVPVTAFAFFHVSIYTLMPMFIILFIYLAISRRSFGAWLSGMISVVSYGIGYLVMCYTAPKYTFENYSPINLVIYIFGVQSKAGAEQFPIVFGACFIALCLLTLVGFLLFYKKKSVPHIHKYMPLALMIITVLCLLFLLYKWYSIATDNPDTINVYNRFHGGGLLDTLPNLRVFALAFGIGIFPFIIVLIQQFRIKKWLNHESIVPLSFLFFYTVIFVNSVLAPEVPYYYYFSRYIVPFIPITIVLGGIALDKMKKTIRIITAVASVGIMLPFSVTLAFNQDITNMDMKSYREVVQSVQDFEPGSIVLLNEDLKRFFYDDISLGSDCYVYPTSLFYRFSDLSFTSGRKLYRILAADENLDTSVFNLQMNVRGHNSRLYYWNTGWDVESSPLSLLQLDNGKHWIKAQEISENVSYINMDITGAYQSVISNANGFEYNGYNNFMWSGTETMFHFRFDSADKNLFRMNLLPYPESVGDLNIRFTLNSSLDTVYSTAISSNSTYIEFEIPGEKLVGRDHILHMYVETWKPSEVLGIEDSRDLGISMLDVQVLPIIRDITYVPITPECMVLVYNPYSLESYSEGYFMWTSPKTALRFDFAANDDYRFIVNLLNPFLPEVAGELDIQFAFDSSEDVIYSTTVDSNTSTIEFIVQKEYLAGEAHMLYIISDTWIPSETQGTADTRELGIPITSVEAIPISRSGG